MSAVLEVTETPQQAARRFSATALRDGYKPEAMHVYTDAAGEPIYWRIRAKHPDGRKWIRPMRRDDEGRFHLGEPQFAPGAKPLYRLHDLAQHPDAVVIVVEGEKAADALAKIDMQATTSGAADSCAGADWQPLAGRTVLIWPDNDDAGAKYGQAVADQLLTLGCIVQVIDVQALGLQPKGDAVDWLLLHPNATAADVRELPYGRPAQNLPETPEPNDEADEKEERVSQASLLVKFVQARAELFHDENQDVYARDSGTGEVRRIDGRQFRDWLQASFFENTEKSARDQSVREAISTLSGLGRFKGECAPVSVRVGRHEGAYYLDLATPGQSRAVKIEPGKWAMVDTPPIMFLRTESMRPLPEPVQGGNLAELWRLLNVPEDSRLLVLTWLADCLRPETPFPVLELIGEQGSAKSTTQTVLRKLIDPNACDLRAAPKSAEDVFVGAGVNWLVSYENVSHLTAPLQDALCVLATGGGFAKRKLYSDADESVIQTKRPVVLNGISAAITAQDLIDRSVSIETPVIAIRTETTAIWAEFDKHHARLIGAFLDVFAMALQRLPRVKLPTADRPRLIEFAHLGIAMAEASGKTGADFMWQFNLSRQESIARTIDASPVATALIDWFADRHEQSAEIPVKTLFNALDRFKPNQTDAWPRSAKGFGDAMRRAAPALRSMGIYCKSLGKIGGAVKWSVSRRKSLKPSPACPASPGSPPKTGTEQDMQDMRDLRQEFSPAEISEGEL